MYARRSKKKTRQNNNNNTKVNASVSGLLRRIIINLIHRIIVPEAEQYSFNSSVNDELMSSSSGLNAQIQ